MKEVICEIVPGLTLNGVVVSEFYHPVSNLVRCKDCKNGEKVNSVYLCGKSRGFGIAHEPDYFCADGERKEGDVE